MPDAEPTDNDGAERALKHAHTRALGQALERSCPCVSARALMRMYEGVCAVNASLLRVSAGAMRVSACDACAWRAHVASRELPTALPAGRPRSASARAMPARPSAMPARPSALPAGRPRSASARCPLTAERCVAYAVLNLPASHGKSQSARRVSRGFAPYVLRSPRTVYGCVACCVIVACCNALHYQGTVRSTTAASASARCTSHPTGLPHPESRPLCIGSLVCLFACLFVRVFVCSRVCSFACLIVRVFVCSRV
jgi:hypothetical protein